MHILGYSKQNIVIMIVNPKAIYWKINDQIFSKDGKIPIIPEIRELGVN